MYSNEHKLFLKKIKKNKLFVRIMQLFIIVFLLGIWELSARLNLINTFISSSPSNIIKTIINLNNTNNLWNHVFITLYETTISFVIGMIIGIFIATLMWWNNTFSKIIDPYLTILNSLPKVALGPIIVIWVGANMSSIILMALLISVIVTIINLHNGFNNIDKDKITLLKSLGAKKRQIYSYVMLPGSITTIISTLKINISMSLIGVIMGEFLVSKEGIGYLIMYGSQVFNLNLVISGIVLLGVMATLLYYIVYYIEKKLINF